MQDRRRTAEDDMLSTSTSAWFRRSRSARRLSVLARHLSNFSGSVSRGYEYDLLVIGGGSGGLACSKEGGWGQIDRL